MNKHKLRSGPDNITGQDRVLEPQIIYSGCPDNFFNKFALALALALAEFNQF